LRNEIVDTEIGGGGGECGGTGTGMCGFETVTIDLVASPSSVDFTAMVDKKMLSFVKSVGTPWAVYQLKISDTKPGGGRDGLGVQHQVASDNWHTISVPNVFTRAKEPVRLTVVHASTTVQIFRAMMASCCPPPRRSPGL
jgi:hypothetical protein